MSDTLQRFLFEHANIRGEIVHLNAVYHTLLQQRPYPPAVRKLLGEALVACVLLSGSLKFKGKLSLQFHGDHRLPLLIAQCTDQLELRGFAQFHHDDAVDYADAFLHGKLVLSIQQDNQTQAYESIVPLHSSTMSENLMTYFSQSEQVSTRIWFAITDTHAAGMVLQLMPGGEAQQREEFWRYATQIGHTITEEELLTLENETLLYRLYHETELRLFDPRTVVFRCTCSAQKMSHVLHVIGEEEVKQLLKEHGQVDITCEFCCQQHTFDAIDIEMLFRSC